MNAQKFLLFFLFAFFLSASTAQADDYFLLMDANQDGQLDYKEFSTLNAHMPKKLYDEADKNKDGFLSVREWEDYNLLFGVAGGLLSEPIISKPLEFQREILPPAPPALPQLKGPQAPTIPQMGNITLPDVVLSPSRGSQPPKNSTN